MDYHYRRSLFLEQANRPIAWAGVLMYPVKHVSDPTEERTSSLLSVLYVCVFWRGEAEQLT
jgi:hypothetical protein